MATRKTVLIFGVSSYIGSNLAEYLKKYFRVIGTYHGYKTRIKDVLTFPCDVLNREQVQLVVHEARPDFTIYAVGLTQLDLCQRHPKLADALNSVGVFNVTEVSERYKARTILLSSAYVFNGSDREFLESDTPDPNTMYGKTKSAAEFYIQKSCLNYIIFRCCSLYGRSINPRQLTFIEALERKLFSDQSVSIDGQVSEGFLDVDYLGLVIKLSILISRIGSSNFQAPIK
jgi:dTDP-4-dehydrorhamnose reductase